MPAQPSLWPVIGHSAAIAYLQRCIRNRTVGHAYLFSGPSQVGKNTVAEQFAGALVCPYGASLGRACEECPSCRLRVRGVHPDWHQVSAVAAEGIRARPVITLERVRALQTDLTHRPLVAERKVALISGAESLNGPAASALLKTVEEPSGQAVILLTCDRPAFLPATLRSRCLRLPFALVPAPVIAHELEQRGMAAALANRIALLAAGRPGRALQLAQNPDSLAEAKASADQFFALVLQRADQRLQTAGQLYAQADAAEGISAADAVSHRLEEWTALGRDHLFISAGTPHLCQVPQSGVSSAGTTTEWKYFLEALRDLQSALRANVHPRWVLELAVLALP